MNVAGISEAVKGLNLVPGDIVRIKLQARMFVDDNMLFPTSYDYLLIENAMLIGACVALGGHPA
jgi:hypothetical protein